MKRYRVLDFGFDSRAWMLSEEIQPSWEPEVQALWRDNKARLRQQLLAEYGSFNFDTKVTNFIDFGRIPFSIFAFHNRFVDQIRRAVVMGAFYPALVASCALGERVLNHLVIALREDFRATVQYKRVRTKDSFDNWHLAIDTLQSWGVLLPEAASGFRNLHSIRVRAIHFRPEVDTNDRALALEAVACLLRIIEVQFGPAGHHPWLLPDMNGEDFIAKAAESLPFVRRIVLQNCRLVGPRHTLAFEDGRWIVKDDHAYEDREVSDDEFRELRKLAKAG